MCPVAPRSSHKITCQSGQACSAGNPRSSHKAACESCHGYSAMPPIAYPVVSPRQPNGACLDLCLQNSRCKAHSGPDRGRAAQGQGLLPSSCPLLGSPTCGVTLPPPPPSCCPLVPQSPTCWLNLASAGVAYLPLPSTLP